jgi:4-carboxymuconolactone decarboxylase
MSRLRRRPPSQLYGEELVLYEAITRGPRAQGPQHFALTHDDGSLAGPFNALLLSPRLGTALQDLGAAVRYGTALSDRVRELAILVVAAHWDSAFERMAHEAVGRASGVTDEEILAVRSGALPILTDPVELASLRVVHAAAAGDIDDGLWTEARDVLDEPSLFELVTLVGYYAALALQLRVFRVDQPTRESPTR